MISAAQFKREVISRWEKTPLVQAGGLWFKLECQNPSGSVKGRGLAGQIYQLLRNGQERAVISSSGNAALAAVYFGQIAGVDIVVFVPQTISPVRLDRLNQMGAKVYSTISPSQAADEYAKRHKIPNIRQSNDPHAMDGFEGLACELDQQLKGLGYSLADFSVFFPVSSGTTLAGFYRGLIGKGMRSHQIPQIHAVQTRAVFTIAGEFDRDFRRKAHSLVPGIVAREEENTYKSRVIDAITRTGGSGWVVSDDRVEDALRWLKQHGVPASLEGALALAGWWRCQHSGFHTRPNQLIMIT